MKWHVNLPRRIALLLFIVVPLASCAPKSYFDPNMDFGSVQGIAVMPFQNLTREQDAGERVRDTFMSMLLATQAVYVLPVGEVTRGIDRVGVNPAHSPSVEQVQKLGSVLGVDSVITGVLREYGPVRSGSNYANVISVSLQMIETSSGRVVWAGATTVGGVTLWDRLAGGGGQPMNTVTEKAINELLDELFQ